MRSSVGRRASLDSNNITGGLPKRTSLSSSGVRRSSLRSLQQNAMHDVNVRLERKPTTEGPTNRKERRERRSRRASEYKQQQEDRNGRMDAITDQWQTHRKSFVSEEMELAELMKQNSSGWCCGMNLCCRW